MKILDKTARGCLLVVDDQEKLLGTLTDGDIRRAILAGNGFSIAIQSIFNKKPYTLKKARYTTEEAENLLRSKEIDLIPVIDDDSRVVDFITWSKLDVVETAFVGKNLGQVPVVIMAGGKGTRLEPFTKILPKPLVPIHDKPIIEHIIERFINVGCQEFYLTVNYKSRIMKAYFEELNPDYMVHFIEESEPLGTAGSLRFLAGRLDRPFFVTNCDIIVKSDYASIYEFHRKNGYDVTLVASAKEYIIPYGTCELNGDGYLSHINEKPSYDFLINTGLYVLNPDVLDIIPPDKFYHITHLIEDLKNAGKRIGVFPIDDDAWIDIGQWAEYQKAVERL
ncbi:MAG: NTP transferase domain-containing protein [SAR324 cluster bacterium]|nr:NTP transferase domain-containing protein [SAR324 cluster bacterium]